MNSQNTLRKEISLDSVNTDKYVDRDLSRIQNSYTEDMKATYKSLSKRQNK